MIETTEVGLFKNQTTGVIDTVIEEVAITLGTFGGEVAKARGAPSYKTVSGVELNRRSAGVFATLHDPPQILTRI